MEEFLIPLVWSIHVWPIIFYKSTSLQKVTVLNIMKLLFIIQHIMYDIYAHRLPSSNQYIKILAV